MEPGRRIPRLSWSGGPGYPPSSASWTCALPGVFHSSGCCQAKKYLRLGARSFKSHFQSLKLQIRLSFGRQLIRGAGLFPDASYYRWSGLVVENLGRNQSLFYGLGA